MNDSASGEDPVGSRSGEGKAPAGEERQHEERHRGHGESKPFVAAQPGRPEDRARAARRRRRATISSSNQYCARDVPDPVHALNVLTPSSESPPTRVGAAIIGGRSSNPAFRRCRAARAVLASPAWTFARTGRTSTGTTSTQRRRRRCSQHGSGAAAATPRHARRSDHAPEHTRNLAARMGRWSAAHWKTATFGWLAFVVAAFAIGGAVGTKMIDPATSGPGESGRADRILDAGFKQPAGESVLVQSDSLQVGDPAFRAAIADVVAARLEARSGAERPLAARPRERRADRRERTCGARRVPDPRRQGHRRRQDRSGPRPGRAGAAGPPGLSHRRVRRRQRREGGRHRLRGGPGEGRAVLAPGHARRSSSWRSARWSPRASRCCSR